MGNLGLGEENPGPIYFEVWATSMGDDPKKKVATAQTTNQRFFVSLAANQLVKR